MPDAPTHADWRPMLHGNTRGTQLSDHSPVRLYVLMIGFALCAAVVFARIVQLETFDGAAYRAVARRPLERHSTQPGIRGRILARDGTVLAHDIPMIALAVHYRYLEQPVDARWLRSMARDRLPRSRRNSPEHLAVAQREVLSDRAQLHRRLRRLTGLTDRQWNLRTQRIQRQVQRIAASVNARQNTSPASETNPSSADAGWWRRLSGTIAEALRSGDGPSPSWITVAEELDYHVVAEKLPLAMVAEIEANPNSYPGVRIIERTRRAYPRGSLASHTLGHLGAVTAADLSAARTAVAPAALHPALHPAVHPEARVGRTGVERQYESQLQGSRGESIELTDRGGRRLRTIRRTPSGRGRDLVLTIDTQLQLAAERLLDDALSRRPVSTESGREEPAGGAIVVMDIRNGAVLAAASAPRFDPNVFSAGSDDRRTELLSDAEHPLLDRVTMMQIPPGSVFKTLSAIALLESEIVPGLGAESEEPLYCRGYLHQPDRHRCLIFRRTGHGHGPVTLVDALARSCNVYFFHYAEEMGAAPLIWWARQAGFGRTTGVDLPDEATGFLPTIGTLAPHATHATDALSLSVGQGSLTVTPLQIARLMAAVANGGELVTPHVVDRVGLVETADPSTGASQSDPLAIAPPRRMAGLRPETLDAVRRGLERVVGHAAGTAHATVYMADIPIAGKTGTAETGGGRGDHAWFAGYVPADRPRWALVVVLQHSGSGATVAGPVARRLVRKLLSLGYIPQATPRPASSASSEAGSTTVED